LLLPLGGTGNFLEQQTEAQAAQPPARTQQDLSHLQADDNQWAMSAKNYASTRYSGLDQINTENVKNVKLAWTFSTGVLRGHEAAPLVVNNTMYIVTPYPNIL
jgi:alcohol dehydrogenase (cytochrome c)